MPHVLKPIDKSGQKKAAEVFVDFQYKAFALTFDALAKALAFYFLLLGACFGIVFQAKPSGPVMTATLWCSLALTLAASAGFAVGIKGLLGSIRRLGFSMLTLDATVFHIQKLDEHFARTRKYIIWISEICGTVLFLIVVFTVSILATRSSEPPPAQVGAPASLISPAPAASAARGPVGPASAASVASGRTP